MSLVSVPYVAACALIIVALMTAVRHRPKSRLAWSVIATIVQAAAVPAAELIRAGSTDPLVQAAASSLLLFPILFPAVVWLNAPDTSSESGAERYTYAAAASVLAFGGSIIVLDPILSPRHAGIHAQTTLFRTEAFIVVTTLIAFFFAVFAAVTTRRLRRSRSRSERRRLRIIAVYPLAFSISVIAASVSLTGAAAYAWCISLISLTAAFFLIFVVADRPLPLSVAVLPAEIVYAVVSAALFALSFAAIDVAGSALGTALGMKELVWKGALVVIIGLLFWPLVMRAQSILQRVFYKDAERVRRLFYEFTEQARGMTSIESIAEAFCSCLEEAFRLSRSEMFMLDEGGAAYRCVQMHERSFPSDGALPLLCSVSTEPRAVGDCIAACTEQEQRILREYEKGTVVPVLFGRCIKGFLFAGPPLTGHIFHQGASFRDAFAPALQALSFIVDRQHLIERLRRDEVRFAQEDRLAILGTFGAGIAHELRNPLNVISTSAQTIIRRPDDNEMHAEVAQFIAEESHRMSRTIDEFLRFSKSNVPDWKNVDIRSIIGSAVRSVQPKIDAKRILVCVNIPPGIERIVTSMRHLEHALVNIIQNAVEAMDEGGSLTITVGEETKNDHDPPERVSIELRDTGRGIQEDLLEKIFDPFFTTKSEGTGLGLPIVRMILNNIGATVSASSTEHGAAFTILLPVDGRIRYD